MSIVSAVAALQSALSSVDIQVYTEPTDNLNTPAVVIGPPSLQWSTYNGNNPDTGTFKLYIVVNDNGYALSTLEPLVDDVSAALWVATDAVVTGAIPGSWGNTPNLPAYVLTVEMSL